MFFDIHSEGAIGWKKLSDADLGRGTSHQTHIGLYNRVLTYLPDEAVLPDSILILNGDTQTLELVFDRIRNPDGSYRSPKIRKGRTDAPSVTAVIRKTAAGERADMDWFLIWFGLRSCQTVFILFNTESEAFRDFSAVGLPLTTRSGGVVEQGTPESDRIIALATEKVNAAEHTTARELELIVQGAEDPVQTVRRYRHYDLRKAQEQQYRTGREGEELIGKYLQILKEQNIIQEFTWANGDFESGLPYDFWYKDAHGRAVFLDVKTTAYEFDQPLVFSDTEMQFALDNRQQYRVFRVYKNLDRTELRICSNIQDALDELVNETRRYRDRISASQAANVRGIKIALNPATPTLRFDAARDLSYLQGLDGRQAVATID